MSLTYKQSLYTRKVAIIGAGYVGSTIAYALTLRELAHEIVLVDIDFDKATGEAMDIQHGVADIGDSFVRAGHYSDCSDCDLIIITAGRNRTPGESRLDMIYDNIQIMHNVVEQLQKYYTKGAIMVVSNPVDILTFECDRLMKLKNGRVFGTGCVLDSSRLTKAIADYTNLSSESVQCFVAGEHGETQFPLWSRMTIAGEPIADYCASTGLAWGSDQQSSLQKTVRDLGTRIIAAKGRTHYGIATCVCSLATAILNHQSIIASVTTPLRGEYGIRGVALSLPSVVTADGVERRLEERLTDDEIICLNRSAECLKQAMRQF